MNRLLLIIFCFSLTTVNAQTPVNTIPVMQPSVKSPEVNANGQVTFRLRAPNAEQVIVDIEGISKETMQKDANGVWTATKQLDADIYDYSFVLDGLVIPDPSNPVAKPSYQNSTQSLLHVPGPASLPWEVNDNAARGSVNHHFYKSGIIGDSRDYYVYLPPNYDPNRAEPYPVLYLLHGAGGNALSWTVNGQANITLDNLINEGKAKPMIMVNTLGYGGNEKYTAALLQEVIPQVEKTYHASKDRNQRAIAGLSMGGGTAIYAGLSNVDKFAWIGGFSSAVMYGARPAQGQPAPNPADAYEKTFPNLNSSVNSQLKLFWIGIGTSDFLLETNRNFKQWLKSKDVKFSDVETPGGHTFMVWRRYVADFAPLLFR